MAVEERKGVSCYSYSFFLPPADQDADDQEDTQDRMKGPDFIPVQETQGQVLDIQGKDTKHS